MERSDSQTDPKSAKKISRKSRSLRSLVIDPFTQMKLGVYVIAFTAIFLITAGWLYYNSFVEQYRHVMQIFEITDPETQWEAISNDVFYSNLYKIGGLFTLFSMALLAVIFRVTHRYHGPLVSIERFAVNMSKGQYYRRVQIRKKDELKSLVDKLNQMAETLEIKHGSLVDSQGYSIRRRTSDSGESQASHADDSLPKSA